MIEIPFWQSAAAGAVLAALITAMSSMFQRRRDDRIESRRSRREAGVAAVEVAYKVRTAITDVATHAALVASPSAASESQGIRRRKQYIKALRAWRATWAEMGTAAMTARAVAAPGVAEALEEIAHTSLAWQSWIRDPTASDGSSDLYQDRIDRQLLGLTRLVRSDAKTDLGTSPRSRWRSRGSRK